MAIFRPLATTHRSEIRRQPNHNFSCWGLRGAQWLFFRVWCILCPERKMNIRIAQPADLLRIVDIYNQAIHSKRSTADLSPLQAEDRKAWFAEHSPQRYPIFVAEIDGDVIGWCSLSAYRPGRMALRFTAEISCYIDRAFQRRGIGKALLNHVMAACPGLEIKNIFGILLERNVASARMMESLGFDQWGHLPRVADFDGEECGHLYFGKRVSD